MPVEPNNGLVVDGYRLLIIDEPGKTSVVREIASAAVATVTALLGAGEDLEARSYCVRVSDSATGAVVAERRFRRRRSAEAAREGAIARHTSRAEGRQTDWQTLLDAAS